MNSTKMIGLTSKRFSTILVFSTLFVGFFVDLGLGQQNKSLPSKSSTKAGSDSDADLATEQDSQTASNQESDLESSLEQVLQGHSFHGEAFNEGPRQSAYLMGNCGNVSFPVTTNSIEAQQFINQGIGQLHGFWWLEAERSFRQAAKLDPECVMAYWGAAVATDNQRKRAKGFIEKAIKVAEDREEKVSEREMMYVKALDKFYDDRGKQSKDAKKKRAQEYLRALESIVLKYPEDVEAKAFVAHRIWHNARDGIPVSSYVATNSLLEDIFDQDPLHPAHHYSIHLWDHRNPESAIRSAARCGVSAPGIAHMWHMPGHIYSRLKRYEDAAYQQEASARIDHAHMMRDRVMPDEISNFSHNNEWLIRNLVFLGRVNDAIDLAKNMIELPRHPKYNTLKKRSGSSSYGRRRLLQVLREYQLHELAVELCQSAYLQVHDNPVEEIKTLRLLACSAAMIDQSLILKSSKEELEMIGNDFAKQQKELEQKIASLKKALGLQKTNKKESQQKKTDSESSGNNKSIAQEDAEKESGDETPDYDGTDDQPVDDNRPSKANADPNQTQDSDAKRDRATENGNADPPEKTSPEIDLKKARVQLKKSEEELAKLKQKIEQQTKAIRAVEGYELVASSGYESAVKKLKEAEGEDLTWIAELEFLAGDSDQAIESVEKQIEKRPQEVIPLARLAYLQYQNGDVHLAKSTLEQLRDASSSIDLEFEIFARLQPIAKEFGFGSDWRKPRLMASDLGFEPPLDSLGPFRWSPSDAPKWQLTDSKNQTIGSKDFSGKPHIIIFYLGHGCLHCAEQLHAFAPRVKDFKDVGIEMVAISTDDQDGLLESIKNFDGEMPIRLASDGNNVVFKAYRAFDDFENQPLHGTFLVDAKGKIRWQDISYEPFMEHEFLLQEAQRLTSESRTQIAGNEEFEKVSQK